MKLLDAALWLCLPALALTEVLLGNLRVNKPSNEDDWVSTLQHLLQFLISGFLASDLKLPWDSLFAALTDIHLGLIIFGHHLHNLPGQD